MTSRLSESFIQAFGEKASKLYETPSEKSNVEIIEAKLSHANAKLNAARMGGAGNVGKLAEEKIRLERELEEAKGSRKNDSPVGDVKPEDVEDHVETPEHDGSKTQAPKRKADRSVSEERSTRTDPVDKTEIKGKFKDRDDKDIDNDGDVDSSDEYLHKRRKAIAKAMKKNNINEAYAIYYKGEVFDTFDNKEEAQDAMNGMDLSSNEKKDYRIRKVRGGSRPKMTGKMMKEEELEETVDPRNYEVGSEKSQFGGYSAVITNKKTGKTMYSGQARYKAPELAKGEAEAYLKGYSEVGDRTAERYVKDYSKKNAIKEEVELEEKTVMQGSKEHLDELIGYLEKAKPGSTDHSQIRQAIESMFGKDKIPKKHRNVKESIDVREDRERESLYAVRHSRNGYVIFGPYKGMKDAIGDLGGPFYDTLRSSELSRKIRQKVDRDGQAEITKGNYDRMVKESVELEETKSDYTIYHKTFSAAVQHAKAQVEKQGYTIDDDEWDRKVAMGPKKPGGGKTNIYTIDLMKNGKETRRKLQMQVYYDEGRYELNMYIS
jgi:hypothetical protein